MDVGERGVRDVKAMVSASGVWTGFGELYIINARHSWWRESERWGKGWGLYMYRVTERRQASFYDVA